MEAGRRHKPLTLEQVQARLRACRLCLEAGYEIFPRAIFSGDARARMMIIGQAPGITEKEAGRPFNAGSGTRLFQWLAEAGIEEGWFRETQYLTSVTKCYPGRARSGSGDRVPSRHEQQLCRPYLEAEIALLNPALIMPVGRLAIEVFFPEKPKLEQVIGLEKRWGESWVVPLPHPSGASRWHQSEVNRQRVQSAVELIRGHFQRLFPPDETVSASGER
jgi:uracil-DNA glycosylase family 4